MKRIQSQTFIFYILAQNTHLFSKMTLWIQIAINLQSVYDAHVM